MTTSVLTTFGNTPVQSRTMTVSEAIQALGKIYLEYGDLKLVVRVSGFKVLYQPFYHLGVVGTNVVVNDRDAE